MITYDLIVASTFFIFLPLTVVINRFMYKRAIVRKWKKPHDYKTFASFLMVIPAQSVTRLISTLTPDTFFLHGISDNDTISGHLIELVVFLVIFIIMMIPTRLLARKYPVATIEFTSDTL